MKKMILLCIVLLIPQITFADLVFKEARELCKNQNYIECGSPKKAVVNSTDLKYAYKKFIEYINKQPNIPAGLKSYQKGIAGLKTDKVEKRLFASNVNGNKYSFTTELKRCNEQSLEKCKPYETDDGEFIIPFKKIGNAVVDFTVNQNNIDIVLRVWGEK